MQNTNQYMQDIIIEIMIDINYRKYKAGTVPTRPLLQEILRELNQQARQALQNLEDAGKITSGRTINDISYTRNVR